MRRCADSPSRLYAAGALPPTGATLPFSKGQQKTIANGLIVRSCETCDDQIEAVAAGGATHLAIDVLGYFVAPDVPALTYVPDALSGNCASVSIPQPAAPGVRALPPPAADLRVAARGTR